METQATHLTREKCVNKNQCIFENKLTVPLHATSSFLGNHGIQDFDERFYLIHFGDG